MPDTVPTGAARGLSEADAQARLGDDGYNELPRPDRRTPLRTISEVLREPMLAWVLLVIATLLAVALVSPWARALFRFGPLHAGEFAVALAVGVVVLVVLEAMKPRWSLARKALA